MARKRSKKKTDFNQYLPLLLIGALVVAFVFLGAGPTGKFGAAGGTPTYTADDCHSPNSLLLSEGSQPPINCCYNYMGAEVWCVGDELPRDESPPPPPGQECTPTGDCDEDGYTILDGDCNDLDPFISSADNDGDGYSTCDGDCNDNDASLSSADNDGDGWSTCDGDYDDNNAECTDYELQTDSDEDGIGDCDDTCLYSNVDSDGDGWNDCQDNCPFTSTGGYYGGMDRDLDGDGIGDVCDSDKDGDGYESVKLNMFLINGSDCNDLNYSINPGNTQSDFFELNHSNWDSDEDWRENYTAYRPHELGGFPDYNCNGKIDLPTGTIVINTYDFTSHAGLDALDSSCNSMIYQGVKSKTHWGFSGFNSDIQANYEGTWKALISSYTCGPSQCGVAIPDSHYYRERTPLELVKNNFQEFTGDNEQDFYNLRGELIADTISSDSSGALFTSTSTQQSSGITPIPTNYALYNAVKYHSKYGTNSCVSTIFSGASERNVFTATQPNGDIRKQTSSTLEGSQDHNLPYSDLSGKLWRSPTVEGGSGEYGIWDRYAHTSTGDSCSKTEIFASYDPGKARARLFTTAEYYCIRTS